MSGGGARKSPPDMIALTWSAAEYSSFAALEVYEGIKKVQKGGGRRETEKQRRESKREVNVRCCEPTPSPSRAWASL